jgi:hypothetical protein
MEPLVIPHTKTTPAVVFNQEKGEYKIIGRSIPADATVFFLPADKWADRFVQSFTGEEIAIDIMLDHLNTGSVRSILTVMTKFLRLKKSGKTVVVRWHFEQEDEDIRDKGEEMSLILNHPFTFIPYKLPEHF